jgi:3-phosphoshikimate 1-carboxyvinyltransferase
LHYTIGPAKKFRGRWRAAGDKSITHRAFIFNALATGTAVLRNVNGGEDCACTRRILEQLGTLIEPLEKNCWRVTGRQGQFRQPPSDLDAGNSGTTMRLLAGLLAGQELSAVIDGDHSLRMRPMARISEPLAELGGRITTAQGGTPPLQIEGSELHGGTWDNPVASAQVKSAFLLAALQAQGESSYREPVLSRDHTEKMLGRMGLEIVSDGDRWLKVKGPVPLQAVDVAVPGDISSAAFLMAAGVLVDGGNVLIKNLGVNPSRSGCLRVLERMGAKVALYHPREEAGEQVADLLAQHSPLRSVRIDEDEIPSLVDEIPILAVVAARAKGESRFHGLSELRVKESDRLSRTAEMLTAFGAKVEIRGDGLIIRGGARLKGCRFDAGGDHRLAMAASVMALMARGESTITGVDAVKTSFPEFPSLMRRFSNKVFQVVTS